MPTHLILFLLLALLLTLTVASAADLVLFDFGKGFDAAQLKTRDTKAEVVDQAGHKALRLTTGQGQDWPGLDLPAKFGPWDLTQYESVCADVRNVGTAPVEVYFRVDNPGADGIHFCITRHLEVAPGQTETLQVTLNRLQPGADQLKIFGVRGSPLGLSDQPVLDPKAIVNLVVFVSQPKQDYTFELSNIRATGTYVAPPEAQLDPAKFFPLIDEFGQYRHRDWPGKTHSAAELVANRELEAKDLAAHPGPEGWDQYGGWQGGPQLQATGFFRPEKYQGKWWLVDPEGRLFWSHGVDCVTDWEGGTRLDEREHWFANLPPADGEFKGCYGQVGKAVNGYYAQKSSRTFDFTRANLRRKYGDDYKPLFSDLAHRRLRSYGMNTIANWSDAAICLQRRTPYTVNIWFDSKRLEGSQGYWGKFRDVFDESFAGNVRQQMQAQVGKSAGDPWCLGYFVDNELGWGEAGYLPVATLACPPDQAAKQAFLADLQAKYGTIAKLNEAWGTQHASWEALAEFRGAPDKTKAAADLSAFDIKTAETYFKTIRDVVKEVAPGNLYLGCRFAWINDTAARAATKYCDVVSYNLYRPSVADFKPLADVPVIIGQFHSGALDRGMF
ncbi:MAG: beta-galactosidase, partial [Armatimonadota bacterium]